MSSFKRAVYKTGIIDEIPQISCNDSLNVDGEEGIYEVEITIGTDTGETGLRYEAFGIPDRFQLFFDGNLVADSKFVGDRLSAYRDDLIDTNKVLPIFEYDGTKFTYSGRTDTVNPNSFDIANGTLSEPTLGKGQLRFNKDKGQVTTMKLRVIGVLGQTLWNAYPICPNEDIYTGSIHTHHLRYFSSVGGKNCTDLKQGTIKTYYSSSTNLEIGTKLYEDKQLLKHLISGYVVFNETIHVINRGEIVDKYPCFKSI